MLLNEWLENSNDACSNLDYIDLNAKISLSNYKSLKNATIEDQSFNSDIKKEDDNGKYLSHSEQIDDIITRYFGCHDKEDETKYTEGLIKNYNSIYSELQNKELLYQKRIRINFREKTVEPLD